MELEGNHENQKSNESSADVVRELARRRETGEIGETDYPIENLIFLSDEGAPISRADVKNQAIVINPEDFDALGDLDIVNNAGEVVNIGFFDRSMPLIIFPEDLGDLVTEAHSENEPTSADLANACRETLTDDDCAELESMEFEEALGYSITLLIEQGIDDPEQFLKEKGIIE